MTSSTTHGLSLSRKRRVGYLSAIACASCSLLMMLAACGSKTEAAGDAGVDAADAREDSTHAQDAHTDVDGGARADAEGGTATDAPGEATSDAPEDTGCKMFDGGPYVALKWNEGCSSTVTNFVIEWGTTDGGPYPDDADAGDPCDAAACTGGDSGERSCEYDLRGLDAGNWCIVTVACDDTTCSSPSGQACVTIPGACP